VKDKSEVTTEGESKAEGEAKVEVETSRDGGGEKGRKPNVYDTIKKLRRERRELREERESSRKREEELNARLARLEAGPKSLPDGKAQVTEEDELTALLNKPGEFLNKRLDERDKKLIGAVREALKQDLAKARAAEERRADKSSA